ncbi:threonine--tRNA ligase [Mesomycoplasma conjunctivae]|uniref:threonine--tRNA ligase n=1 Tax=Mesomycoplasma conjunctivae TaxID=45361 RepID=UPI003DA66F6B
MDFDNFDKSLNHSTSHLLALAIKTLYPDVKLGFGPSTKEGFYYDFEFSTPISNLDLPKIEKLMKKLASSNLQIVQTDGKNIDFSTQIYKKELLEEFESQNKNITFYSIVDAKNNILFEDLCVGGHVGEIKNIKHFKLLNTAGAYWRGDSKNIQLTRIYGTSWHTQDELNNFLAFLEERKERDHRKIGKELKIFTFTKWFGLGFPVWLENGMKIHNKIKDKILAFDKRYGFREVLTPHFGEKHLYETSGHLAHYKDDMFEPIKAESDYLIPRPMTCPHHIVLFDKAQCSYRQLPYRISEQSRLYRFEKSGALTGLERVRSMDLTEGHIFVSRKQIFDECKHLFTMIEEVLDFFEIKIDYISFSRRDPEDKSKFYDDEQMWNDAENDLKKFLDSHNVKYVEKIGEAAFYGPKIDFQIKTVLNKEITISTLQLDFLLPKKFNIYFNNENNEKETPVLIHRGLIGTYERFISILLEQTKGVLPFWLSPNQVSVIPILSKHEDYAEFVRSELAKNNFEVEVDARDERITKKIREAQIQKVKYQLIIGDSEVENQKITYREYGKQESTTTSLDEFIKLLNSQNV